MITIKNERGVALVFVLILALIGLAIVSSLIYMMTTGTRSSGAEKFYRTADEAAFGGARIGVDLITTNFDSAAVGGLLSAPFQLAPPNGLGTLIGTAAGGDDACLTEKLSRPPAVAGVGFANWGSCNTAGLRNVDPTDSPDMRFTLTGLPNSYNVFAKIVDTVEGNTAGIPGATGVTGGVGGGGASVVTPPRRSWMYRIEIQAEDAVNPRERARYSVLYAR